MPSKHDKPAPRFAINRMVAPRLPLDAFLDLARRSGAAGVEIRNDVEGREFADGMPARQLRQRIADASLEVASVNALQRFNDWTADRAREAFGLFTYAAALGAPAVVLCPVVDANHGWSGAEAAKKLRQALHHVKLIAKDTGVTGLVEPLGMPGSTLRHQKVAAEAIQDVGGAGPLMICHDTFQVFRSHDQEMFPKLVAMVHVSGIARTDLPPEQLSEPDRGFVDGRDISDVRGQLQNLQRLGYAGWISMEPFDPSIHAREDVTTELKNSLAFLAAGLDRQETVSDRG